jgi:hypothetical protein
MGIKAKEWCEEGNAHQVQEQVQQRFADAHTHLRQHVGGLHPSARPRSNIKENPSPKRGRTNCPENGPGKIGLRHDERPIV